MTDKTSTASKAKSKSKRAAKVLQLKITLKGTKPSIWRRIQITDDSTFADLHRAIRDAMGWIGGHMHEFEFDWIDQTVYIGTPDKEADYDITPESKTLVRNWLGKQSQQCNYAYDFGDDWEHTVLLEKTLPADDKAAGVKYPRCIAGKRACPPEDCGGIWGYADNLKILKDPKHEDYADTLEFMGEDFDPEAFSPETVVFRTYNDADTPWLDR